MLIYLRQGDGEAETFTSYGHVMIHVRDQQPVTPAVRKVKLSLVIMCLLGGILSITKLINELEGNSESSDHREGQMHYFAWLL